MVIGQVGILLAKFRLSNQRLQCFAKAARIIISKEDRCSCPQFAKGRYVTGHDSATRESGLHRSQAKRLITRGSSINGGPGEELAQLLLILAGLKVYVGPMLFLSKGAALGFRMPLGAGNGHRRRHLLL